MVKNGILPRIPTGHAGPSNSRDSFSRRIGSPAEAPNCSHEVSPVVGEFTGNGIKMVMIASSNAPAVLLRVRVCMQRPKHRIGQGGAVDS